MLYSIITTCAQYAYHGMNKEKTARFLTGELEQFL